MLILSASKDTLSWPSLDNKLATIKLALNSGKNADWLVDIRYKSATPLINSKKRIDHKWLADYILPASAEGNDWAPFHFSRKQHVAWDIKQSLRGSNPNTDDGLGDMWFWADEDTKRKGYDQFVEDVLHEGAHEYFSVTGLLDVTHEWHEKHGTIVGLYKTFDWNLYFTKKEKQTRLNTFLKYIPIYQNKLKNALKGQILTMGAILAKKPSTGTKPQVETLLHPVEEYKNKISQPYGNPNTLYTVTGVHIGTDYATPVGTPVRAPSDGEVIYNGTTDVAGNFIWYRYKYKGKTYVERYMHLDKKPILRTAKKGDIIAVTGNTGMSSGPHLHQDLWENEVKIVQINKNNWSTLTLNPQKHYVS